MLFTLSVVSFAQETEDTTSDDSVASSEIDESKFGDANKDGRRDAADARIILRISALLEQCDEEMILYCDYNRDGYITASDARTALRVSALLENVTCILHGHDLCETVIAPTCTKDGYTTNKCSRCGYTDETQTNIVSAFGHTLEYIETVAATCTSDGYEKCKCSVCGEIIKQNTVPATGHNYTSTTVKATCTTDGYTKYTCSNCGDTKKENISKATGHNYIMQSYESVTAHIFKKIKNCSYCGDVLYTYDVSGGDLQIATSLLSSGAAKAICEKWNQTFFLEGYDITGTKVVAYSSCYGIDIDGYYYEADGTLQGNCPNCGKAYGRGENMCVGMCTISWGDVPSASS